MSRLQLIFAIIFGLASLGMTSAHAHAGPATYNLKVSQLRLDETPTWWAVRSYEGGKYDARQFHVKGTYRLLLGGVDADILEITLSQAGKDVPNLRIAVDAKEMSQKAPKVSVYALGFTKQFDVPATTIVEIGSVDQKGLFTAKPGVTVSMTYIKSNKTIIPGLDFDASNYNRPHMAIVVK